jgi:hypothetical protein
MSYGIKHHLSGEFACVTRPKLKSARLSGYPSIPYETA